MQLVPSPARPVRPSDARHSHGHSSHRMHRLSPPLTWPTLQSRPARAHTTQHTRTPRVSTDRRIRRSHLLPASRHRLPSPNGGTHNTHADGRARQTDTPTSAHATRAHYLRPIDRSSTETNEREGHMHRLHGSFTSRQGRYNPRPAASMRHSRSSLPDAILLPSAQFRRGRGLRSGVHHTPSKSSSPSCKISAALRHLRDGTHGTHTTR